MGPGQRPPGSEPVWGLFQDTDLLSPGALMNATQGSGGGGLESCRHLSRSNVDIPRSSGAEDPKRQLPRKRSDSSTYELDTIQQHQAFLSRWAGPVGAWGADHEVHHRGRRPRQRDGSVLTLRTRSCSGPHGESGLGPQLLSQNKVTGGMGLSSGHAEGHLEPQGTDCLAQGGGSIGGQPNPC